MEASCVPRRGTALLVVAALGLAPAPLAGAAGRSIARTVPLAGTTGDESFSQLQQAVAVLPGGTFATVWAEGAYPAWTIRMQWVDASGQPLLAPGGVVLAGGTGVSSEAVVVPHPSAGAYVGYISSYAVMVQRFDGSGQPVWPGPGVVAATLSPYYTTAGPHLVSHDDGVFVCFHVGGAETDIHCQSVSEAGAVNWEASGVSVGHGPDLEVLGPPRGVADGVGGLLVFYRNQRDPFQASPPPMRMEGQRFDAAGNRLWGTTPLVVRTTNLAANNGYTYTFFQVVSDGGGGAVLAFDDWTGTSDRALDVMAQRVSREGDLPWGDGAVVTGAGGHQQHVQTIAGPDGGAFVTVWETVTSAHNRLRLFRLGPDGAHLWAPEGLLLSDPSAQALDYDVFGSLDDGILRLAWTHQLLPGGPDFDVRMAGYTLEGVRIGGPPGSLVTGAPAGQFLRGLAYSPADGKAFAAWEDNAKGWTDMDVRGAVVPCRFLRGPFAFVTSR